MKKLLVILSLALTSQAFAMDPYETRQYEKYIYTLAFTSSPLLTTNGLIGTVSGHRREAALVLQDIQDYNQTGVVSILLADKMNLVKSEISDLSDSEIVDLLANVATNILK